MTKDEPGSGTEKGPEPPSGATAEPRSGLAARAAAWSAEHRRLAIWGWIAFVVVAVFIGNAVGREEIHGADQFTGEAGRAERALENAGQRPNDDVVDTNLWIKPPGESDGMCNGGPAAGVFWPEAAVELTRDAR